MEVWQDLIVLFMLVCFFTLMFLLKVAPAVFIIYLGYKVIMRMYVNSVSDNDLNVNTVGLRKWEGGDSKKFYRTESTPYRALETLYSNHDLGKSDKVVDFGAGRGRVAFFIHQHYGIDVTGIELNEITFEETEDNLKKYHEEFGHFEHKIDFQCINAEDYVFDKKDNVYFFFNPFNEEIFENVINKTIENADENMKDVKVILYYPTRKYRKVMKKTDFEVIEEFAAKGRITSTEKFIIYEREY